MIDGLIAGKLYGAPQQRTGKSGKAFVVGKIRTSAGDGESLFVNVIAFDGGACTALLALADGDAVSLAGTLTPKVWTDEAGVARPVLDIVAAQVLTAYHVQRKRKSMANEPAQRTGNDFTMAADSLDF